MDFLGRNSVENLLAGLIGATDVYQMGRTNHVGRKWFPRAGWDIGSKNADLGVNQKLVGLAGGFDNLERAGVEEIQTGWTVGIVPKELSHRPIGIHHQGNTRENEITRDAIF